MPNFFICKRSYSHSSYTFIHACLVHQRHNLSVREVRVLFCPVQLFYLHICQLHLLLSVNDLGLQLSKSLREKRGRSSQGRGEQGQALRRSGFLSPQKSQRQPRARRPGPSAAPTPAREPRPPPPACSAPQPRTGCARGGEGTEEDGRLLPGRAPPRRQPPPPWANREEQDGPCRGAATFFSSRSTGAAILPAPARCSRVSGVRAPAQ